jgi:hypothetical protein
MMMKPLDKMFLAFLHATVMNTFLINKSPTKNALIHLDQAIHPPPYVGNNTDTKFGLNELKLWLKGLLESR